ncbi:PPK2 family polyphosphate:nucleotide phosphotransferase [Nakamurella sp. UYEF19]|uniref:PPK2 family polyphosphate kinase n=1 Tax=Nakamurella sp. UYEF19 TaxID=1756392 RepID=UPI003396C34C
MAPKKSRSDSKKSSKKVDRGDVIEQVTAQQDSTAKVLSLPPGPVDLRSIATAGRPAGPQQKDEAQRLMIGIGTELAALQEKLVAESIRGGQRRVLLVLQGMDTSGKDGVVKHVLGLLNPAGVHLTSFKKPNKEELAHDFLWRIAAQVPLAGQIGVFNRSQYEDVLVVRVHDLVPREEWSKRYAKINAFERGLLRNGTVVVKCFLHISKDTQRERLEARLDDPTKYWKYNPADLTERGYWSDYQDAYAEALRRCNTLGAPWFVIPSDRKWYRNWAIASLLLETLRELDPQYPPADFNVDEERERLAES